MRRRAARGLLRWGAGWSGRRCALDRDFLGGEGRELIEPLLDRAIEVSPAVSQLLDEAIGEHDHEHMASGAALQTDMDRSSFEHDRLGGPEALLHECQIAIAVVHRLG